MGRDTVEVRATGQDIARTPSKAKHLRILHLRSRKLEQKLSLMNISSVICRITSWRKKALPKLSDRFAKRVDDLTCIRMWNPRDESQMSSHVHAHDLSLKLRGEIQCEEKFP